MSMPIEVVHNQLADSGSRCSLLLVRQDYRTIEIVRCDDELVVVVTAVGDDPAQIAAELGGATNDYGIPAQSLPADNC